jgi:hypothetical protein
MVWLRSRAWLWRVFGCFRPAIYATPVFAKLTASTKLDVFI